ESRIRAFEATLDCPQPPGAPNLKTVTLAVPTPGAINKAKFESLRLQYDLAEFTFPEPSKKVGFFHPATGDNFFEKWGYAADNDHFSAATYPCKVKAPGYELKRLVLEGEVGFSDGTGDGNQDGAQNTVVLMVDGNEVAKDGI